ncbi:pyridoxal phosphate-dependent aminotransferase [Chitinophaga pinensis]|uniref:Aminotransferase n=1 Tax=Chitinophaga pinensis TaxID=79329 RepID=A0A5C6LNZ7_9BACT|nr:aminotransferase class I/II-fold pyridoxal phosphate-dependent enzyme [Chitinophaga pinensis]TWV96236.1 aminotransferase class I/II-fold pyridoxal phosphate-dependent enzyme [Chitinophaga pinensis]
MINGHGDDRYLFNYPVKADFSSNVYYEGFAGGLRQHLTDCLYKLNNYPEANAQRLQQALADWHQLTAEQVLVTNGATEAFYLVAHAFRRKSVTIAIPAFAEYEDASQANDLSISYIHYDELHADTRFIADLVFFGNPNNPTGAVLQPATIRTLLTAHPQTIFMIDEAYVDFTEEVISMVGDINQLSNLIIIKSLTKTYSIPGLRLGYILSNADIIHQILASKMPWSVNALAIEAGLYIAQHRETLALPIARLRKDTLELMTTVRNIEGIQIRDTHTNFFLSRTKTGTAADLKRYLLQNEGLLIRDAANFKSLTPQHFRVATQRPEENQLLIKGIQAWINSIS